MPSIYNTSLQAIPTDFATVTWSKRPIQQIVYRCRSTQREGHRCHWERRQGERPERGITKYGRIGRVSPYAIHTRRAAGLPRQVLSRTRVDEDFGWNILKQASKDEEYRERIHRSVLHSEHTNSQRRDHSCRSGREEGGGKGLCAGQLGKVSKLTREQTAQNSFDGS